MNQDVERLIEQLEHLLLSIPSPRLFLLWALISAFTGTCFAALLLRLTK